jgi:hypothetical protein
VLRYGPRGISMGHGSSSSRAKEFSEQAPSSGKRGKYARAKKVGGIGVRGGRLVESRRQLPALLWILS